MTTEKKKKVSNRIPKHQGTKPDLLQHTDLESPSQSSTEVGASLVAETKRCPPNNSDNEESPESPSKKPRITMELLKKPNVAEENVLLLELKDDKNMKWPEIVEAFREYGWPGRKLILLKNRYKNLKEGTVFWEDDDRGIEQVDFMHQAIFQVEQEYERTKWDNVAERMVKLGASRKFTGAACVKKFKAKAENNKKVLADGTIDSQT